MSERCSVLQLRIRPNLSYPPWRALLQVQKVRGAVLSCRSGPSWHHWRWPRAFLQRGCAGACRSRALESFQLRDPVGATVDRAQETASTACDHTHLYIASSLSLSRWCKPEVNRGVEVQFQPAGAVSYCAASLLKLPVSGVGERSDLVEPTGRDEQPGPGLQA